jgi:hypothetical protein
MSSIVQDLHDRAIGGTVRWLFDGAWSAELGQPNGFTAHGRGGSAAEVEVWLAVEGTAMSGEGMAAGRALETLQRLHDAEIGGEMTWRKPEQGFKVEVHGEEPRHFLSWAAAADWLKALA